MKKDLSSKHPRWLLPVLAGILCAALTVAAVWYDLAHNGGRLVYPMNSYAFQSGDMPMLTAVLLDVLYVLYLLALLIGSVSAQRKQATDTNRTLRLSPKLGLLGFLGFLGLLGFWSCGTWGNLTPFAFFTFFGFFGFYFEGKMSDTFMDERYRENVLRAQRDAYHVSVIILFVLMATVVWGGASAEASLAALVIGISLDLALTLFLSVYLLYRYDHDDAMTPDGEEG